MTLKFEATKTSYAIEIDQACFLDLLDSESHVTENAAYKPGVKTLDERLKPTPANDVEYDGHFGSAVYLSLNVDDDTPEVREHIAELIEGHLAWCATLPKRPSVVERRQQAPSA